MKKRRVGMLIIAVHVKHCVLRHFLWVALILLLLALATLFVVRPNDWRVTAAILAVPFSFLVATQKQKREELELFARLFADFNRRYERLDHKLNAMRGYGQLSEKLNVITGKAPENEFEGDERNVLFTYFNLCGEEYLYYRQGYIYPEVWKAWCNGMKFFRENLRIRRFWDKELEADSYYGLYFDDAELETPESQTTPGESNEDPNDGDDCGVRDAA